MATAGAAAVAALVGTVVVAVVPSAVGKLQWAAVGTAAARADSDTVVLAVAVGVVLRAVEEYKRGEIVEKVKTVKDVAQHTPDTGNRVIVVLHVIAFSEIEEDLFESYICIRIFDF